MRPVSDHKVLYQAIASCTKCNLAQLRVKAVLPEGNSRSGIMMIAQSPGEVENRTGRMFVGPSGKLFDELLDAAGVSRNDFYLTNLIKCMLPKSRRPSRTQWEACTPWLEEEIRIVSPRVVVPLGFQALKFLLIRAGMPRPPRKEYRFLFGKFIQTNDYLVYPLRHPTALLFNPEKRKVMTGNYSKLKQIVGGSVSNSRDLYL